MSVIKVENLTFAYQSGLENIFENVNFQIDSDWKLGFIGRNGRGKTTFLKLLQGKLRHSGKIVSSVLFDYFPYPVPDKTKLTKEVLLDVCPAAQQWQFLKEFSALEVRNDVLFRPFNTLSNGEQTKVLLSALFLNEGHFLLIDEPTNHLDLQARQLLSMYLHKKKSFILVSHDRLFLDGCVDHILSLNKCNIEVQRGNFSSFMQNFERQQAFEQTQNEKLQADIERLQETANKSAAWSNNLEATKRGTRNAGLRPDRGYIGHKSAKLMKRAKAAEARQQKKIEQKSKLLQNVENESALKISPLSYRAERLVAFSAVAPNYNGREICAPVSFEINRGERIALAGKNGCGKSSLLKLLCGQKIAHSGTVDVGANLIVSYVPQDVSHLCGTLTELAAQHSIDESLFKAILYKMGFSRAQFDKNIAEFSDGQKKKTLIAKSLCEQAHLYVWDEPLNFVDVYSRIQIENLLLQFQPTLIFVEHDSAFQNNVATRIIQL